MIDWHLRALRDFLRTGLQDLLLGKTGGSTAIAQTYMVISPREHFLGNPMHQFLLLKKALLLLHSKLSPSLPLNSQEKSLILDLVDFSQTLEKRNAKEGCYRVHPVTDRQRPSENKDGEIL